MQRYRKYCVKVEECDCHQPLLVERAAVHVHDISKGYQKPQRRLHESSLVVQLLVSLRQLLIDVKLLFLHSIYTITVGNFLFNDCISTLTITERIVFFPSFLLEFKWSPNWKLKNFHFAYVGLLISCKTIYITCRGA